MSTPKRVRREPQTAQQQQTQHTPSTFTIPHQHQQPPASYSFVYSHPSRERSASGSSLQPSAFPSTATIPIARANNAQQQQQQGAMCFGDADQPQSQGPACYQYNGYYAPDSAQSSPVFQFPPSHLATPRSLPVDRGHWQHFSQQSTPQYHSSSHHQQYYSDGSYFSQSPTSPESADSWSPMSSYTNGLTPTQSAALVSGASLNRILAARMPTNAEVHHLSPFQFSPTATSTAPRPVNAPPAPRPVRSFSASYAQAPQVTATPIAPSIAKPAQQQQQQTPQLAFALTQTSPVSGPVEAIHPRYRPELKAPQPSATATTAAKASTKRSASGDCDEEKLHACEFAGCAKRFKRLEHLRRHEKTHTQDRPYGCEFEGCGRWFSRSDNLTQHRKTHLRQINGTDHLHGTQPPSSPEPAGW